MKSIIKSLVLIVAVAAIAGGATYAYFTSQATVTGNTFATGTLHLNVSPQTAAVNVSNAEPGVWLPSAKITVLNDSTILGDLKWKVTSVGISETASGLFNNIQASVWAQGLGYDQNTKTAPDGTSIDAQNVWNGSLKDLAYQFKNMPKGWSASVWIFTKLDNSAGNQYQGQSTSFNLVFDSTQAANPGWTQ